MSLFLFHVHAVQHCDNGCNQTRNDPVAPPTGGKGNNKSDFSVLCQKQRNLNTDTSDKVCHCFEEREKESLATLILLMKNTLKVVLKQESGENK